jgi:glucose/arabinose dehydrogenase
VRRIPVLLAVLVLAAAACGDDAGTSTSTTPSTTTLPPVVGPGTTTPTVPPVTTTTEPSGPLLGLDVETVARTLINPVFLSAPVGDDRLFVLEKDGFIEIVTEDGVSEEPFLDIEVIVGSDALEQGLLGLAFHPDYASNGRFFVYYTNVDGDTRLAEYRVSDDPDRADPESAVVLLAVDQPEVAHNGGMLLFGPDGYLYVTLGDGGGAGDEFGNAQNIETMLGSVLRLDIDGGDPYAVPPDNPFLGDPAATPQIWVYGLRNPWRIDIDSETGLLYIADVGQDAWEEVSVVPLDSPGTNFGWPIVEGFECYRAESCDSEGMVEPVIAYPHAEGCSIIGGFVYRGAAIPELRGHYFYGDWCGQWVRSFRFENGAAVDEADWTNDLGQLGQIQSFGLGGDGEMYVLTLGGFVYRLVPVR